MIKFGPAGSGGLGNIEGLKKVKSLGLEAMEIAFTYGVKISNEEAKEIGLLAKELGISLSVHAPYYINLASLEKIKIEHSKKRIFRAAERANYLGAKYVVFHAGFYQERDKDKVYDIIKKEMKDIVKTIKKNKWKSSPTLETTGKGTQFGTLDELLRMRKDTGCEICVDFAHLFAREGSINYDKVFEALKGIKHIHAHFSGIERTDKGEKRHIITDESVIKPLIEEIVKRNIDITIINESPQPFEDSLKTKMIGDALTS